MDYIGSKMSEVQINELQMYLDTYDSGKTRISKGALDTYLLRHGLISVLCSFCFLSFIMEVSCLVSTSSQWGGFITVFSIRSRGFVCSSAIFSDVHHTNQAWGSLGRCVYGKSLGLTPSPLKRIFIAVFKTSWRWYRLVQVSWQK
jgi:hypothetical protein